MIKKLQRDNRAPSEEQGWLRMETHCRFQTTNLKNLGLTCHDVRVDHINLIKFTFTRRQTAILTKMQKNIRDGPFSNLSSSGKYQILLLPEVLSLTLA